MLLTKVFFYDIILFVLRETEKLKCKYLNCAPFVQWSGPQVFILVTGVRSPQGVPNVRSLSSVGRAPALQAGGHWFEPSSDHHFKNFILRQNLYLSMGAQLSWLERWPVTPEVAGSSPVAPAIYAQIAQSVEQGTENPCVRGSIPRLGTTYL